MKTLKTILLSLAFSAAALAGTEARPEKGFKRVQLNGAADVKITKGASYSISVTADDAALIKRTHTAVSGDTLLISTEEGPNNFFSRKKVQVAITMPELRSYDLSGAGNGDLNGFSGGDLELTSSGAGNTRFTGSAEHLKVNLSGSGGVDLNNGTTKKLEIDLGGAGNVTAKGFTAHDADVDLSGTGNIDVTVNDGIINAEMSGVGHVVWRGTAKLGKSESSGVGSISHRP